ncbi:MAG: phage virion morphogenesis protein [Rhodocyclaceae bacterium]|nr:phage virion morphogenesis protein [Rhodocyclaceae bacterium]
MAGLEAFEARLAGLITALEPPARRPLARQIAIGLRRSEARRIAAQTNPDGRPFEPRKPTLRKAKGKIKRQMFAKLRTSKWMQVESSADAAVVTFAAQVQAMARVHHYGLRDRVSRRGGPEVQYPARRLLGFNAENIAAIEAQIIEHLSR